MDKDIGKEVLGLFDDIVNRKYYVIACFVEFRQLGATVPPTPAVAQRYQMMLQTTSDTGESVEDI